MTCITCINFSFHFWAAIMEQQRSAGAQNIRNVFAGVVDGVDMSSGYMGLGRRGFLQLCLGFAFLSRVWLVSVPWLCSAFSAQTNNPATEYVSWVWVLPSSMPLKKIYIYTCIYVWVCACVFEQMDTNATVHQLFVHITAAPWAT